MQQRLDNEEHGQNGRKRAGWWELGGTTDSSTRVIELELQFENARSIKESQELGTLLS